MTTDTAHREKSAAISTYYQRLYESSGAILAESLQDEGSQTHAASHAFLADVALWIDALGNRREVGLLKSGAREFQFGLLALVLGQYREAFSSLRLFLELSVATVFYSAHELLLREWLRGVRDNNFRRMVDPDRGVFSIRFADAFAPALRDHTSQYRTIASKVYRECSHYVHANSEVAKSLPSHLAYNKELFNAWHQRLGSAWLCTSFLLFARYYNELTRDATTALEASIQEQLGHLDVVREQLARRD